MKKIVLTIVAMLSMTTTFAETVNSIDKAAFTLDVNNEALARSLSLTEEQEIAVSEITSRFEWDMRRAGKAKEADRQKKLRKAVNRNLANLSKVLTPEQYRKYKAIVNATFVNRGLISMI